MQSISLMRAIMALSVCVIGLSLYAIAEAAFLGPLRTYDTRITELAAELDGLLRREAAARTELVEFRARPSMAPADDLVMVAASPAISSAALQERVRSEIVKAAGASITSQAGIQDLPDGSAKISVLVRARFNEMGVMGFVRALESSEPPIFFDSLEIHPVRGSDNSSVLEFTGVLIGFHSNAG
jgi:hypothetical protein